MNTAARLHQGVIARGWVISVLLTKTQLLLSLLTLSVLMSAISMVYVAHLTRHTEASTQQALAERHALNMQWGQLLLERSTHVMQARVQHVAEHEAGMVIPDNQSVVIVNE